MNNSEITGLLKVYSNLEVINSTIYGYSLYDDVQFGKNILTIPAIHILNTVSSSISIINSEIICAHPVRGARPIIIENISSAKILFMNSTFITGTIINKSGAISKSEYFWRYIDTSKGMSGILIANCNDLTIDMKNSQVTGGNDGNQINSTPGGPGIEIINSHNVLLKNGSSIGKNGHDGGTYSINRIFHAANGGNGIDIINSSVVLENIELTPGRGGAGDPERGILPGKDGIPIYQDENSTVSFVTSITDWSIH